MKTIWQKFISLLMVPAIIVGSLLLVTQPAHAADVQSVYYIKKGWDADSRQVGSETSSRVCTPISSDTVNLNGWYYVTGTVENDNRLVVDQGEEANIILTDGSKLKVKGGINVHWSSRLNIYGQAEGTGELICYSRTSAARMDNNDAAIGSNDNTGPNGAITIHGGKVTADTSEYGTDAAGIGAGNTGAGGTITIYDGTIVARGGSCGAGIGGGDADGEGRDGGTITIYGGDIKAYGGVKGAGIGGGEGGNGGTVTIWGGKVYAEGGATSSVGTGYMKGGAGIGSGYTDGGRATTGGTNIIHGGEVEAVGGEDGAGIGGGDGCIGGLITITGGTVKASSNGFAPGIGAGDDTDGKVNASIINITGGTVEATGGAHGAGIGGGEGGGGGNIFISGGTVTANAGYNGAGIGGGDGGNGDNITISGGTVTANASANTGIASGAGIGGGKGGAGTNIIISGGHVDATGGAYGAGIGNGQDGTGMATTITLKYADASSDISVKANSYRYNDGDTSVTVKMENPFMDKDTREAYAVAHYTGNDLNQFKDKTLVPANTYAITVSETQNGSVVADKSRAVPESTITLTVTPDEGWQLKSGTLKVIAGEDELTLTQDASDSSKYTFSMPAADVTVVAEFIEMVPVESVSLSKEETTLERESTETLTATVLPEDTDTTIVDRTVTWKSSDENVATVDDSGKVTAVAPGTATITVTATNGTEDEADDKKDTCVVTVTPKAFNITNNPAVDGVVKVKVGDDEVESAKEGETVTLITTADIDFELKEISVTDSESKPVETTEVTAGEEYTFTMPSSDVTVSATFEKVPVTILVDVGEGHESLFTQELLNDMATWMELESATIDGSIVTLKGVHPSNTEYSLWEEIAGFVDDLVESAGYIDNGELFRVPGYRTFDEYATDDELDDDIYDDARKTTPVSEGLTYYLLWAKPYEKLDLDNGNPTCGKKMWDAFPTVPEGFRVDPEDSYWVDENDEIVETFEGGKTYTFKGRIYLRPDGELWKYYINPDNFTLTVKDGKDLSYSISGDWINDLTFTATVEHDWATPTYEWSQDNKTVTAKRVCKQNESHVDTETATSEVETTAPTCEKAGKSVYTGTFENSAFETQTKTVDLKATGHKWGAPTYTWSKDNSSVTATRICSNDKSHKETETVKTTSKTTEPTTTKEGKTVYTATFKNGAFKTQTKEVAIPKKEPEQIWYRLYGNTGLDTMKAIVEEGFTKTGGTVVVATKDGFKDALAAAGFAGLYKAPIVLTDGKSLSAQAQQELQRLKPSKVFVVGGTAAVKDAVLSRIKKATGVDPIRYFGANSAATSAQLANKGKGKWKESTAIIATNKSFKDALSVAPIAYAKGYPILLADNGTTLTKPVLDALKNIGTKQVIIVGGELAVTKNVVKQLNGIGITVKIRLQGANGVKTSAAIANWGLKNGMTANKMGVATSQDYKDALSGAALCGINKSVLVLADDKAMDNASFPKTYKAQIKKGYVFGGEKAVGPKTWTALNNATK